VVRCQIWQKHTTVSALRCKLTSSDEALKAALLQQHHAWTALSMLQVKSRRLKQLHWDKIKTPQQGTVWAKDQPQVNLNLTELENLFQVIPPAGPFAPLQWRIVSAISEPLSLSKFR